MAVQGNSSSEVPGSAVARTPPVIRVQGLCSRAAGRTMQATDKSQEECHGVNHNNSSKKNDNSKNKNKNSSTVVV